MRINRLSRQLLLTLMVILHRLLTECVKADGFADFVSKLRTREWKSVMCARELFEYIVGQEEISSSVTVCKSYSDLTFWWRMYFFLCRNNFVMTMTLVIFYLLCSSIARSRLGRVMTPIYLWLPSDIFNLFLQFCLRWFSY